MRNKQKLTTAFTTIILSATMVANLALAQTPTPTPTPSASASPTPRDGIRNDRQKMREARSKAIGNLVEAQIKRAQNHIDKMDALIKRIKALELKLDLSAYEKEKIDELIEKAETQKSEASEALEDMKEKAAELLEALSEASTDTTRAAPAQLVKDFMASVNTLKKSMIALHTTLKEIVKEIRSYAKQTKPTPTPSASVSEENE